MERQEKKSDNLSLETPADSRGNRGERHCQASEMTMSPACQRLAELRKSPKPAGPSKTGGKDPSARSSGQGDLAIHALLFKPLSNGVVPSLCSTKPNLMIQHPSNSSFWQKLWAAQCQTNGLVGHCLLLQCDLNSPRTCQTQDEEWASRMHGSPYRPEIFCV